MGLGEDGDSGSAAALASLAIPLFGPAAAFLLLSSSPLPALLSFSTLLSPPSSSFLLLLSSLLPPPLFDRLVSRADGKSLVIRNVTTRLHSSNFFFIDIDGCSWPSSGILALGLRLHSRRPAHPSAPARFILHSSPSGRDRYTSISSQLQRACSRSWLIRGSAAAG